jgi:hypothetical protein
MMIDGIDLNYYTLLQVAKGYAQREIGYPSIIMVTGASEGGKTATVLLAAENACDTIQHDRSPPKDVEEFLRAVGAAAGKHGYLLIDEAAKTDLNVQQFESAILAIKRKGVHRALWEGHVPFGTLPVIVLADVEAHPAIHHTRKQIARRIVHVRLAGGSEGRERQLWTDTCGGDIVGWRSRKRSPDNAKHAQVLLGEAARIIEAHSNFIDAAKSMGYGTVFKGDGYADLVADRRSLFLTACSVPDAANSTKWPGRGNKLCNLDDGSALTLALRALGRDKAEIAQRLNETDWNVVLGHEGDTVGVYFDVQDRRVCLRFYTGSERRPRLLNADLAPELVAAHAFWTPERLEWFNALSNPFGPAEEMSGDVSEDELDRLADGVAFD